MSKLQEAKEALLNDIKEGSPDSLAAATAYRSLCEAEAIEHQLANSTRALRQETGAD